MAGAKERPRIDPDLSSKLRFAPKLGRYTSVDWSGTGRRMGSTAANMGLTVPGGRIRLYGKHADALTGTVIWVKPSWAT
jgi:hypothetical protein